MHSCFNSNDTLMRAEAFGFLSLFMSMCCSSQRPLEFVLGSHVMRALIWYCLSTWWSDSSDVCYHMHSSIYEIEHLLA